MSTPERSRCMAVAWRIVCGLTRLTSQLSALRRAGFENVDCLFRNGIFSIYCGRAPIIDANQAKPRAPRDKPPCPAHGLARGRLGW